MGGWLGRGVDGRVGVFTFPDFFFRNNTFFFQMCLAIRGNDFNFFFMTNKPKVSPLGSREALKNIDKAFPGYYF